MSVSQSTVMFAIVEERAYQDRKWGTVEENPHEVGQWIAIMQRELDEAREAYDNCWTTGLLEILQVAAVAVACLEQHGVQMRGDD